MGTENSTICKMCYMEINLKAKKCPYCQHWQNKWSMITFHPLFAIIPTMAIFIVLFGFMGTMFHTMFSEGKSFSRYVNSISIIETEMVFGVRGNQEKSPIVAVLGTIRNDSGVSWEDITLEACFFDKDGKLIDAIQEKKYSFTIPANDESRFKLSFHREFPQEKYDSCKLRVISAKDERQRF